MEPLDENTNNIDHQLNSNIDEQKIISLNKFIILCIASCGLYLFWWMYKVWTFFKQKGNLKIAPAFRSLLCILFLYPLFEKILAFAKNKGYDGHYWSGLLFFGFIVLNSLGRLPDPFWLITLFNCVFFIPPFKAFNYARLSSTDFIVTEQTSFNGRQITLIVIGAIVWALGLLGMAMGDIS